MIPDEERYLLSRSDSDLSELKASSSEKAFNVNSVAGVILASTGVFISGIDQSFISATYVDIASSMKALQNASLLLTAYNLGYSIALPLYGKLSDDCGRKSPLLTAYLIFAAGCLLSGSSLYFWQIIIGRVVTGIGAAGMVSLVSVIITDSVPPSQVASMTSYVTVISVLGRCSGGVLGAFILEFFGWQWSFMLQVPLILICSLVSFILMPESQQEKPKGEHLVTKDFDILGFILFILAICSFLRATSQKIPEISTHEETHFSISTLLSCIFGLLFLVTELFYARNPFVPLNQLGGKIHAYLIVQVILFFAHDTHLTNLPPYFVYSEKFRTTITAIYLITSSIGYSLGSVMGGHVVKVSHRTKVQSILSLTTGIIVYLLIAIQWKRGAHFLEVLYIFLAGFTLGVLLSALFGALATSCSRYMIASTITSFYLCQEIGSILGTGLSAKALQSIFRALLYQNLPDNAQKLHIIAGVSKDINFFKTLPLQLQHQIQDLFLVSFKRIAYVATGATLLAMPILLIIPDQIIE
ncbi:Vacuolar membrane amino acid uptake transporter fnx2 [Golovinomyces cichoracearum]|uniref:Vacuolar membrane amino acid uptake transporter fnx2 n=1 Tax=Golovinomyces cichoracearum TaxID=62708 RepID=A0A420IWJ3_9PEZI|nr:Vacuolar membrane amino acid uptake transporter fnx2 [Golovinomyces cichoracearum]